MGEAIHDGVVFLDNVIDANSYPFGAIETATRRTRKIGLGVMGLADLFALIGVAYDCEAGLLLADKIAKFLTAEAWTASIELAQRRGSFPAFAESVWPQRGFAALRNATVTCVAPTGTISLIAGASSSIEPYFALALSRRVLDGVVRTEVNPLVEAELTKLGAAGLSAREFIEKHGSLRSLTQLPAELCRRFPSALEIAPEYHVGHASPPSRNMSTRRCLKLVNLPPEAPLSTVKEIFMLAHDLHLKGITVYRYGCRPVQTLSLIDEDARPDCRDCAV